MYMFFSLTVREQEEEEEAERQRDGNEGKQGTQLKEANRVQSTDCDSC